MGCFALFVFVAAGFLFAGPFGALMGVLIFIAMAVAKG